jgi:DNA-binding transcriptional ArsR family regulator
VSSYTPPHLAAITARLQNYRRDGRASCPCGHEKGDPRRRLSVRIGDNGAVLLHCHDGHEAKDIMAALGLPMSALYPEHDHRADVPSTAPPAPTARARKPPRHDEPPAKWTSDPPAPLTERPPFVGAWKGGGGVRYAYGGSWLYRTTDDRTAIVIRWNAPPPLKKKFQQCLVVDGRLTDGLDGAQLALYREDEVGQAAASGLMVVLVEGEKCADAMRGAGFVATTNAGGARGWQDRHADRLCDLGVRLVVVWPDDDAPGLRRGAAQVRSLLARGIAVRVVRPGADAYDYRERFETAEAFAADVRATVEAAHPATPATAELLDDAADVLEGYAHQENVSAHIEEGPEQKESPPGVAALVAAFRSAADLAADPPPPTRWRVGRLLPEGALVQLTGAAKGGGKTTFLLHALSACVKGREFLGEPTDACPVVYLTEQARGTFENEYLAPAGLRGNADLHVLYGHLTAGHAWETIVGAGVEKARAVGAGVLVIDTFAYFARVTDEQDAAVMGRALRLLQDAAAAGLTVVVVHHDRKGGGEAFESGRGSSAFAGAVDVILNLRRGGARPSVRELRGEGRYEDLYGDLIVELTDEGYVSCGTSKAVARVEAERLVRASLPVTEGDALRLDDLLEAVKAEVDVSRATVQRVLAELSDAGVVRAVGKGTRGDAKRFYLLSETDPIHSAQAECLYGQNEFGAGGDGHASPPTIHPYLTAGDPERG